MFCHNCGKELKEDAKFCPRCGTGAYDPLTRTAAEPVTLKENVPMGIAGACIGGLLGIGLYLLCSWNGIYPAFVGIFLSAAVIIGYDLLGKRRGGTGTTVVTLLLIILPTVAYLLSLVLVILENYEEEALTLFEGIGMLFLILAEGNVNMGYLIQDMLALYGFAILGAVLAFFWSMRRERR